MTVGPISLHVAEDQFEGHLRRTIQDYLGAAVASDPALSRVDAEELLPLTWGRADDWDPDLAYESHYLPAVFITSGGTDGDASYDEGLRFERALIGVRVVAENARGGDVVIGANVLTRLYEFALKNLLEQRKSISDSLRIEQVLSTDLSANQERGLAFCDVEMTASVCTASVDPYWLDDPVFGDPPRTPDELVPVEQINIVTEPA